MPVKLATRRSKRQSKVVTTEVGEEERSVSTVGQTETVRTEEDAESTKMKQEEKDQDEQDSQIDAAIEVKGSTPTVTVSWGKKNEEEEGDDSERRSAPGDQMTDQEMMGGEEQAEAVSSADATGRTDTAPTESSQTKMEEGMEDIKEDQESKMDTALEGNEDEPTVTVTWAEESEEGQSGHSKQESSGSEQMVVKEEAVNGKRKATPDNETSPSKKAKLINDGFCLFVGNLNKSKTFEEVTDSLASFFMTQSILVQDIRLDRSRKHAHIDLASEMDLTKALTLNGGTILDKQVNIAKAKVKREDRVRPPKVDKKVARNARCLFVKNVPYNATKEDILKVFHKGVAVRFPGGTEGPSQGIAFVDFEKKAIAEKVRKRKREFKIQGRVLIVDSVGERNEPKVTKAGDKDKNTRAAPPPNNTLFLSNLSQNVKEKNLKSVFQKAVRINIPQNKGKSKGFAFVEFATVEDAEKALQTSQKVKINKRVARVQFFEMRAKPEKVEVQLKTLIVMGLAESTTAETLKSTFEGAQSARVTVDKKTGVSKRFGFVEFASEKHCKAVKDAMEDCEIDGSKVTVAYAKLKVQGSPKGAGGGSAGQKRGSAGRGGDGGGGQPAGRKAGKGRKGGRGGKGRAAGAPQPAAKEVENKG